MLFFFLWVAFFYRGWMGFYAILSPSRCVLLDGGVLGVLLREWVFVLFGMG